MAELTNREFAALWFDDVADKTRKLTSGNVSHDSAMIRGLAKNSVEYLDEFGEKDDELLEKAKGWFKDIASLCERITTGNVSHMAATIRGKAIRCREYIKKHIND